MIFIVLGGLVLKIWPLLGGLSFRNSLFAPTPPIFRIAATRKRNGVEISNSQNFLVSMVSTSVLNKKKLHDIGCTPLFESGWNDPIAVPIAKNRQIFRNIFLPTKEIGVSKIFLTLLRLPIIIPLIQNGWKYSCDGDDTGMTEIMTKVTFYVP